MKPGSVKDKHQYSLIQHRQVLWLCDTHFSLSMHENQIVYINAGNSLVLVSEKKQLWLFRKWCHCKKWSYTKISQHLFVNSLFFYPQLINISSPFICCFKNYNETLLTQSCISCPSDGLATASSQWMLAFPWRQILLRVL